MLARRQARLCTTRRKASISVYSIHGRCSRGYAASSGLFLVFDRDPHPCRHLITPPRCDAIAVAGSGLGKRLHHASLYAVDLVTEQRGSGEQGDRRCRSPTATSGSHGLRVQHAPRQSVLGLEPGLRGKVDRCSRRTRTRRSRSTSGADTNASPERASPRARCTYQLYQEIANKGSSACSKQTWCAAVLDGEEEPGIEQRRSAASFPTRQRRPADRTLLTLWRIVPECCSGHGLLGESAALLGGKALVRNLFNGPLRHIDLATAPATEAKKLMHVSADRSSRLQ